MEYPPPMFMIWLAYMMGSISEKEAAMLMEMRKQKEAKNESNA